MELDMDLFRGIMFEIEKSGKVNDLNMIQVEGHSTEEISYHILKLKEAGLITAKNLGTAHEHFWIPLDITNRGYDFIRAARNKTLWNRAKSFVFSKDGVVTLASLTPTLLELARQPH